MNLKAIILPGQTEITVNGLHQWDYGRALEIQSADLPALLEVHFACPGMKEAVVRSCSGTSGVATAVIPDVCLEQTAPITAWVYEVGETTGATIITITLPIIARTRPQVSATIPTAASDKYTEAVAAMNEAVEKVSAGQVKVQSAAQADSATRATSAGEAGALAVTALASGTDINTVTTPGLYSLTTGSYTNAKKNGTLRLLEVVKYGKYIWQTLIAHAYNGSSGWVPPSVSRRCYTTYHVSAADGGSQTEYGWTEWVEEINTQNISRHTTSPILEGSVALDEAEGQMQSALQSNTLYLVQIKGSYATGKVWIDSGTFLHTSTSASHFVTAGDHYIEISNKDISVMKLDGTLTDVTPVTVYFYKMGSIA